MSQKLLATSASTLAVVAASSNAAWAQSLPGDLTGYTLTIEGGVGTADNPWEDKAEEGSGSESDFADKVGDDTHYSYMGSVALSRERAPMKDLTTALSFGGSFNTETRFAVAGPGSGFIFNTEIPLTYFAGDVEWGQTVRTSGVDLRTFYGLRGLYSESVARVEAEKFGSGSSEPTFESGFITTTQFVGVGPRAGVGFSTVPQPGGSMGNFGISGNLGVSMLVGRSTRTSEEFESGSSVSSSSESESDQAFSLDAQIGIDYHITETAKVSVGYQRQQFWNIDPISDFDNEDANPRILQGIFVGMTTEF